MSKDVIFVGWNRIIPGREKAAGEHFQEFMGYVIQLEQEGAIDSYEPILLTAHGGDLNGFVLLRGEISKLQELKRTDAWALHVTRAGMHIEGFGVINGVTGAGVMEWMERWTSLIPD